MRIFRNICSGVGLLSIVGGILFFIGWLFYSAGKLGATALAFGLSAVIDYFK